MTDTLAREFIQSGQFGIKSQRCRGLCNAGAIDGDRFHFAVEINFQGQGRSVKNRAAILAAAQVTLYFARDFGRQSAFQVFAD
jgi:hypothetical protein